jgi:hypothetical protein
VDTPLSPLAEMSALQSLKPTTPGNAQGPTRAEGTATSKFHATPSHDTVNIPQRPEPTNMPEVIPLSPRSYELGAPNGPRASKGSSMPSSRAQPVIPPSERVEPKPLYLCLGCSNHTYNNNMIQMQCSIKHNKYLLHNDPWALKMFIHMQQN